jgi:hypothetical protein
MTDALHVALDERDFRLLVAGQQYSTWPGSALQDLEPKC